ncbi:MAG: 4Fe-4S dicluster domain-containing protein [Thermoleophilia bacterium]|nr:4Fe-4S dicluster domain-containing protein [Thermoleophilia bacterium]
MMRFIEAEKIPELLASLTAGGHEVWAPQEARDTGGAVLFDTIGGTGVLSLDRLTTLSAKHLLLPGTEKLFSFRYALTADGERVELRHEEPQPEKTVLFGARACDARAITILDALFSPRQASAKTYNDPHYRARRENITVITLACVTCDAACFCSSFPNGSAEKSGSDVFMYPVEDGFLAEAITGKGGEITAGPLFEDSELEPPPLAETARVDLAGLKGGLMEIFADMDFWSRATEKCLSCGYCTYSCPACYCFNITDEMRSDREGERLRSWDSCMFHLYTQETSGHNPRPAPAHRFRNRVNHKFSYYPANQGEILCTGCGRCVRGCPAGLDIREVLEAARARAAEKSASREVPK